MNTNVFCTNFLNTRQEGSGTKWQKFSGHPRFLPSKPKEDKLSREGTNVLTPTPVRKTPSRRSPDPKSYNLCALFLPESWGERAVASQRSQAHCCLPFLCREVDCGGHPSPEALRWDAGQSTCNSLKSANTCCRH